MIEAGPSRPGFWGRQRAGAQESLAPEMGRPEARRPKGGIQKDEFERENMSRKLKDIEAVEISLVDAAANRKKFFLKKRRQDMDELIKLIKDIFGEAAFTDEELELCKAEGDKVPAEALKAIKSALLTLSKYKDDMPDDVLSAIKTLAKYSTSYGYPAKKSADGDEEPFDVDKAGKRLSKATLEQLQKIKEIVDTLLSQRDDDLKKKGYDKLPPEVKAKLEELETLKAANLKKEEIDKQEKAEKRIKDLEEKLEKQTKRLEAILKGDVDSKQLDELDDEDEEKDKDQDPKKVKKSDADLWPSLVRADTQTKQ